MNFFHPLDGHVLLHSNGVFSEHQLYHKDGEIFARKGNGYVRLLDHHATSKGRMYWADLKLDKGVVFEMGRMVIAGTKLRRAA